MKKLSNVPKYVLDNANDEYYADRLKNNTDFFHFESVNSLVGYLLEDTNTIRRDHVSAHMSSHRTRFTGTKTIEEAYDIALKGNEELKNAIKANVDVEYSKIKLKHEVEYVLKEYGLFFDVGMVQSGEPECWFDEHNIDGSQKDKIITLPVNASYTSRTTINTILDNASKIIALVKAIEDSGVQVELNMYWLSEDVNNGKGNRDACISINIKEGDDRVNYNLLSGVLHPSFFRRLIFRTRERLYRKDLSDSYGRSIEDKALRLDSSMAINKLTKKLQKKD